MSFHLLLDEQRPNPIPGLLSSSAVWVDPADLGSMRQGRNGATAAALNQPVGFLLNKGSTGTSGRSIDAALGVDISGYADTGTWTAEGTTPPTVNGTDTYLSESCRSVTLPAGVSGFSVSRGQGPNFTITSGRWYRALYRAALSRALTAGETIRLYHTGVSGLNEVVLTSTSPTGWTTYDGGIVTATASGPNFLAVHSHGTNLTAPITVYVRQFSVRELPGSHFVAPSDAARPVLRNSGSLWWLEPDGVDDWLVASPAINLGDTWWHVGGWRADNTGHAFAPRNDFRAAVRARSSPVDWAIRNAADTGLAAIATGTVTAPHVLTAERASATSMSGRFNATTGSTATTFNSTGALGLALFNAQTGSFDAGLSGRFYGGAWSTGALSEANRTLLERHFGTLSGVTIP